jgi:hypothetical protein
MTKAEEIRNRRMELKAQRGSDIYNKLKEIRKELAIAERNYPNSAIHKGILQLLLETKEQLKRVQNNRFILTD